MKNIATLPPSKNKKIAAATKVAYVHFCYKSSKKTECFIDCLLLL
jgi:hypothetical protein